MKASSPTLWATLSILLLAGALAYGFFAMDQRPPPPASGIRADNRMPKQEFVHLFNRELDLASLAQENFYTVVEIYLDTCSLCKRLEQALPRFLEKRKDVLVIRLHYPEGGMNLSEADKKRLADFRLCATPHIAIFGPDRRLMHVDQCTHKVALRYLRSWISQETGIPQGEI